MTEISFDFIRGLFVGQSGCPACPATLPPSPPPSPPPPPGAQAAGEMRERLGALLGTDKATDLFAGTFHR